jgi:chromosome partitioning protein
MAKVISFISRKGGSGKTTNAINLATTLHSGGKRVILIETDPNYTISAIRKLELYKFKQSRAKYFDISGSSDRQVSEEIAAIKKRGDYDYIIVDSAGKTTDSGIKELCLSSDMVIITTSLTQNDLLVTYQTVKDLKPATELNKKLKLVVLPNRIHSSTRIRTIKEVLQYLRADILDVYVPQKKIFTENSTLKAERRYKPVANVILQKLNQ